MSEEVKSVVTPEMVEAYKARFEGVADDAATGSLRMWENGDGELDARLCQKDEGAIALFAPLVEAYFKAKGEEVPESVKVPFVEPVEEPEKTEAPSTQE